MPKSRVGLLTQLGIDRRRLPRLLRNYSAVQRDERELRDSEKSSRFQGAFQLGPDYRIYGEKGVDAGTASGHYFHQDLLVARAIYQRSPRRHIDVGSRIDGFVAHVASFREVEVLDIRSLPEVSGISFRQADIMHLPEEFHRTADSVSCLHALEHFGLGRYGDPIDFDGWWKGLQGLQSLLQPDGTLYLSVPTGVKQRIEFNAHRVFSIPFLIDVLGEEFHFEDLSFVHDDGSLSEHVQLDSIQAQESFSADYGCSIWTLRKRATSLTQDLP